MTSIQTEPLRAEYVARINRVMDYIENHIDQNLSLEMLARVACFSRYHFHRIFGLMVGETLNQYIQRIRVEKAAALLVRNPKVSITEIALDCGFSGSAAFARVFKESFEMSASQWRSGGYRQHAQSNEKKQTLKEKVAQNLGSGFELVSYEFSEESQKPIWHIRPQNSQQSTKISVEEVPDLHVVYVRHIGPYQGDVSVFEDIFQRLTKWAGPRDLLRFPQSQMLCVYHDDPGITDEGKLKVDACLTVPKDTPVEGEVGYATLPGGKVASGRFAVTADSYGEAWYTMMAGWLPISGFQPDDRVCYEHFCQETGDTQDCQETHLVDICIPVRPL